MDHESSQTSSATNTEAKPRMTLDKHLALEARVEALRESVIADSSSAPTEVGSVSREEFDNLKQAFIKVATMSGHGNNLSEFDMKMWVPTPKDMKKYAS